jgi:pteridine reductase
MQSPRAILWHEHPIEPSEKQRVLERIPMGGLGKPSDIARTVTFLLLEAPYVTGQVIAVDGVDPSPI